MKRKILVLFTLLPFLVHGQTTFGSLKPTFDTTVAQENLNKKYDVHSPRTLQKLYNGFDSTYSVGTGVIDIIPINFQRNDSGVMVIVDQNYLGVEVNKYMSEKFNEKSKEIIIDIHFQTQQKTSINKYNSSILFLFEDGEIKKFKYYKYAAGGEIDKDVFTAIPFTVPLNWGINKKITAIRIVTLTYKKDYEINSQQSDIFNELFNLVRDTSFSKYK